MAFSNKIAEVRYAFERDMVRRHGYSVFRKHGIMGMCDRCSTVFEKKVGNQKYCSDCKPVVRREQVRRDVRKHRERNPRRTEDRQKIMSDPIVTNDPWVNLMFGLMINAEENGDQEFIDEFRELFEYAILGRRLDG